MISTATDSTENFIYYSGSVFVPELKKWKLIGSCKMVGRWGHIIRYGTIFGKKRMRQKAQAEYNQQWLYRQNNKWKNILNNNLPNPVINPMSNIDSTEQSNIENNILRQQQAALGITETQGIFYKILNPGTGAQVQLTDSVTVHYKGYTFGNNIVFDQTKTEPINFPLKGLIKGWQIGLPLLKAGGKIQLYIPSGQAYGIRSRSPKIPPNSILVFEVEVVKTKSL
jgi:FKBP-type peptidyl-prolyl cis-trans isomerase FkpA